MLIMERRLSHLLCCCIIFFLLLLNPLSASSDGQTNLSTMDFVGTLAGARKGDTVRGISTIKKYLAKLGYLNANVEDLNNNFFDDNLVEAIKSFQTFVKIEATGTLDPKTLGQMNQPRCGVPDNLGHSPNTMNESSGVSPWIRAARFTFFGGNPKWPPNKRTLTYAFPKGTRKDAHHAMFSAVQEWAKNSPFKFREIRNYEQADVKISFQVKNHGDGVAFDGPGGILAHAFAPTDGRLHYDGDETWVDGVQPGKLDLQTVGLHEMGHILGLMHSTDQNAIMWPYIRYGSRKHLNKDDIDGINTLYK